MAPTSRARRAASRRQSASHGGDGQEDDDATKTIVKRRASILANAASPEASHDGDQSDHGTTTIFSIRRSARPRASSPTSSSHNEEAEQEVLSPAKPATRKATRTKASTPFPLREDDPPPPGDSAIDDKERDVPPVLSRRRSKRARKSRGPQDQQTMSPYLRRKKGSSAGDTGTSSSLSNQASETHKSDSKKSSKKEKAPSQVEDQSEDEKQSDGAADWEAENGETGVKVSTTTTSTNETGIDMTDPPSDLYQIVEGDFKTVREIKAIQDERAGPGEPTDNDETDKIAIPRVPQHEDLESHRSPMDDVLALSRDSAEVAKAVEELPSQHTKPRSQAKSFMDVTEKTPECFSQPEAVEQKQTVELQGFSASAAESAALLLGFAESAPSIFSTYAVRNDNDTVEDNSSPLTTDEVFGFTKILDTDAPPADAGANRDESICDEKERSEADITKESSRGHLIESLGSITDSALSYINTTLEDENTPEDTLPKESTDGNTREEDDIVVQGAPISQGISGDTERREVEVVVMHPVSIEEENPGATGTQDAQLVGDECQAAGNVSGDKETKNCFIPVMEPLAANESVGHMETQKIDVSPATEETSVHAFWVAVEMEHLALHSVHPKLKQIDLVEIECQAGQDICVDTGTEANEVAEMEDPIYGKTTGVTETMIVDAMGTDRLASEMVSARTEKNDVGIQEIARSAIEEDTQEMALAPIENTSVFTGIQEDECVEVESPVSGVGSDGNEAGTTEVDVKESPASKGASGDSGTELNSLVNTEPSSAASENTETEQVDVLESQRPALDNTSCASETEEVKTGPPRHSLKKKEDPESPASSNTATRESAAVQTEMSTREISKSAETKEVDNTEMDRSITEETACATEMNDVADKNAPVSSESWTEMDGNQAERFRTVPALKETPFDAARIEVTDIMIMNRLASGEGVEHTDRKEVRAVEIECPASDETSSATHTKKGPPSYGDTFTAETKEGKNSGNALEASEEFSSTTEKKKIALVEIKHAVIDENKLPIDYDDQKPVLASIDIASSEHDAERTENPPIEGSVRSLQTRNNRANHSDSLPRILVIHEESNVGPEKDSDAVFEDCSGVLLKPVAGLEVEASTDQDFGGDIPPHKEKIDHFVEMEARAEAQQAGNGTKSFRSPEMSAKTEAFQIESDVGQVDGVSMETISNPEELAAPTNIDQRHKVVDVIGCNILDPNSNVQNSALEHETPDVGEDVPTAHDARMAEETEGFRGDPERSPPVANLRDGERGLLVAECPENVDIERTLSDIDDAHKVEIGPNTEVDGFVSGSIAQDEQKEVFLDAVNEITERQQNATEDIVHSEPIGAEGYVVENASALTKDDLASPELKTSENHVVLPHFESVGAVSKQEGGDLTSVPDPYAGLMNPIESVGAVSKQEGGDLTAVPEPNAGLMNPIEGDVSGADHQLDKPLFVVEEYITIDQNGSNPCLLSDEDALKSPQVACVDSVSSEIANPLDDATQTNGVDVEKLEQISLLSEIEANCERPAVIGVQGPGDPVLLSDLNASIVTESRAVDCNKCSPPVYLEVDTFAPCSIASKDEVPQLNVGKLKIQLYTAAVRAHRGKGVEKLFVLYWNNLCRYVNPKQMSGTRMWEVVREEINSFLTTRKLRRLHNALLLGIMQLASHTTALGSVMQDVPSRWRARLGEQQRLDGTDILEMAFTDHWKSAFNSRSDVWSAGCGSDPLGALEVVPVFDLTLNGNKRFNERSLCIPGALVVDPLVRSLVEEGGLKVAENAIWLMVIAVREYVKSTMKKAIAHSQAIAGPQEVGFSGREHIDLAPKLKSKEKKSAAGPVASQLFSSNPNQRGCITALDIASLLGARTSLSSVGGVESHLAYERCLVSSFGPMQTTAQEELDLVCQHISSIIERNGRTKRIFSVISKNSDSKDSVFAPPLSDSSPPFKKAKVEASVKIATPPPTHSHVSRNHALRRSPGLGRGAKNLAALKARSSSTGNETGNKDALTAPEAEKLLTTGKPEALPMPISVADISKGDESTPSLPPDSVGPAQQENARTVAPAPSHVMPLRTKPDLPDLVALAEAQKPPPTQPSAVSQAGTAPIPSEVADHSKEGVSVAEESESSNPPPGGLRGARGRGFGVKNLAAMRSRSSTVNESPSPTGENAPEKPETPEEAPKPAVTSENNTPNRVRDNEGKQLGKLQPMEASKRQLEQEMLKSSEASVTDVSNTEVALISTAAK